MMTRCIITGANGFVGQAACVRLRDAAWQVLGAVRSMEAASTLPAGVCQILIGPAGKVEPFPENIDFLVHLAARVHVIQDPAADPLAAFREINTEWTIRLAGQAAQSGVKRFVFLSTIKVNGEVKEGQYSEADTPDPSDPYALSKFEAEQGLLEIGTKHGMEVTILRPPLVYGEGVKANFLRLLNIVDRGFPLPLGRIRNRRSMIYLGNLVDAIHACAVHSKCRGRGFPRQR
jgi:nucleoside-diphosphate-sugar epimerase